MYFKQYVPLPVCENISKRGISLPSYPTMTDDDVIFVSESVNAFFK
jgi:perosamine synthetase